MIIAAQSVCGYSSFRGHAQTHSTVSFGNFRNAQTIATDPMNNIFVIDKGTNEVLKFSLPDSLSIRIGGYGWTQSTFDDPTDVVCPNGIDVYVTDYGNHRIQKFDKQLTYVSTLDLRNEERDFRLGYPLSIDVDRFGSLFILEGENRQIIKINARQSIELIFGGVDAGKGRLIDPKKIRVSAKDRVYALDNDAFKVYDIFGNYLFETKSDSLKSIVSFAVRQDTLFVLQQCKLSACVGTNVVWQTSISCEVVDVAVREDVFVFLTKKNYYYLQRSTLIH